MESLKVDKAVELLPQNDWNISQSMRQAGYKASTSKNGTHIARVRESAKRRYFDEAFIRQNYKKTLKDCIKTKDKTNTLRALEGMARLEGIGSTNIKQDISTVSKEEQDILSRYGLLNVKEHGTNTYNNDIEHIEHKDIGIHEQGKG
jgi:hypothetical protein